MKLNETYLELGLKFKDILSQILDEHKIEQLEINIIKWILSHQYKDIVPLVGTNAEFLASGEIEYLRPTKNKEGEVVFKKVKASPERYITKLLKDLQFPDSIPAATIEKLCGRIKKELFTNLEVKLIVGEGIKWCYNENNGYVSSCMSTEHKEDYLSLYTNNPEKVACMVCLNEGKVVARSLIFNTLNGVTREGIYYKNTAYQLTLEEYLTDTTKRNQSLFEHVLNQNANVEIWKYLIQDEWTVAGEGEDEIVPLNIRGLEQMPYIDTYSSISFIDENNIELYTETSNYAEFAEAKCTNGNITCKCPDCLGDLTVECTECDGTSEIDCNECEGRGKTDCDVCDGEGEIDCAEDCDEGWNTCDECKGQGIVKCCDDEDCYDCNGDGQKECEGCKGIGKTKCDYCDKKGKIECSQCEGDRTVECPECNGYGVSSCYKCEDGKMDCKTCTPYSTYKDAPEGIIDCNLSEAKKIYL